jgi:uncharacterized membrane protein YcaP (DUF421 family)
METIQDLFGQSEDLTILQMLARGIVVFILALVMLRLAGRKTFGKQSVADNVIMIMLGALLSRAITASSPFLPVIITSFSIVVFHRLMAWISLHNPTLSSLIKGDTVSLFKAGQENRDNMKRNLISKEDLMEGVRLQVNKNELIDIEEIFIERNGHMSVIKSQ